MKLLRFLSPRKVNKLKLTNSLSELLRAYRKLKREPGQCEDAIKIAALEQQFSQDFGGLDAVIYPHARVAVNYILKSYDFPPGSEVLMTPLSIADMVNSIHLAGLKPRFVDIELKTLNYDIELLEKAITPNTKALLVTYIAGVIPNMDKILAVARKHGLKVIEDCSQAVFATYRGQQIGTLGDVSVFSLTNFKVVSSLFGGMVLSRDKSLIAKLRAFYQENMRLPDHTILAGHTFKNIVYRFLFNRLAFSYVTYFLVLCLEHIDPKITYRLYSGNIKVVLGDLQNRLLSRWPDRYYGRFTAIQAELGLGSLKRAAQIARQRMENGELLRHSIRAREDLLLPDQVEGAENAYWRFPLLTSKVDKLKLHLLHDGFDSAKTFLTLCSAEPGFAQYNAPTPKALEFKNTALILEIDETLSKNDVLAMASSINRFFELSPQEDRLELSTLQTT